MEYVVIGLMTTVIFGGASVYFLNKKVKELEDSIDFNRERIIDDLGEDLLAITEGVSSLLQLVVKLDPYIIERDLPPTEDDVAS